MKKLIINAIVAFLLVFMPMAADAATGTMAGTASTCSSTEFGFPLHVNPQLPTIVTSLVNTTSCENVEFDVDIAVTNFTNVGSVSLALNYDTTKLTYLGYENLNSALDGGLLFVNARDGVVYVSWMSLGGASIGNGILMSLKFSGIAGSSTMTWYTSRCEYANIQGMVFPDSYQNGTVTIDAAPYITSQPSNKTICEGSNTSFSVETEGQNLTFQWCVSEDEGASWTALVSGDLYSDVNTETLLVNTTSFDMNGNLYRCEVNGSCGLIYSNPALLTVGLAEDFYQVVVTASPENGGEVTGEGVYYQGNSVTITATTNTGWHFVNWTENDVEVSTDTVYVFSIHEDHDFTAHFELNQYTISLSGNIDSAGVLTGDGVYNYGETCTVSAVANEGFTFIHWTRDGNIVTTEPSFSFTVTENASYLAHFTEGSGINQTIGLSPGWNWWSTYLDITLDDLKEALVATGNTSITIKSKTSSTTYNGVRWRGNLNTLDVTQMYKIQVDSPCEITLSGMPLNPAEHPITIKNGPNWIGFPLNVDMNLTDAFAGFAVNGDMVKSKTSNATYNGTRWRGVLNALEPGQGYIYNSADENQRTFVFPTGAK